MRNKSILICATLCALNSAYAYTGYGLCNYGKQTVDSIVCYGPTVMKETIVTGDIKVTGSLQAENFSAQSMQVTGDVNIKNAHINNAVNVTGSFIADHAEFGKGVAVTAKNITLSNSVVKGLMTITSKDATPYLQLQCNSSITGAVLFDGKPGVIQITGDSIVQGKIVNGSLEFVKRDCT